MGFGVQIYVRIYAIRVCMYKCIVCIYIYTHMCAVQELHAHVERERDGAPLSASSLPNVAAALHHVIGEVAPYPQA